MTETISIEILINYNIFDKLVKPVIIHVIGTNNKSINKIKITEIINNNIYKNEKNRIRMYFKLIY